MAIGKSVLIMVHPSSCPFSHVDIPDTEKDGLWCEEVAGGLDAASAWCVNYVKVVRRPLPINRMPVPEVIPRGEALAHSPPPPSSVPEACRAQDSGRCGTDGPVSWSAIGAEAC